MAISAIAIVSVLRRHRLAPLVAVSAGPSLALGFAVAHWLPEWSALSDPFLDGGESAFTAVASLLEIVGAAWLGWAGWRALQARGGLASAAS